MAEQFPKRVTLTSELWQRPVVNGVRKRWLWLLLLVALLAIGAVGFLYYHAQQQLNQFKKDLQQQQTDPAARTKQQNDQVVDSVGKLIILPTDEQPTIATVSDLSKLQDQPFFAKAQIGDKVLIYSKAKKAILYRPSENVIVELAPLVGNNATAPQP